MPRSALIAFSTVFAMIAFPAMASADNYCVGVPIGVTCASTHSFDEAGFVAAVSAAAGHAGADAVHVAAGTIDLTAGVGGSGSQELDIVGAGIDQTIFESDTDGSYTLMSFQPSGAGSEISGMTLRFKGTITTGSHTALLLSAGVTGRNLRIADDSNYNNTVLANVGGGATLTQSTVEPNSTGDTSIAGTSGNANVSDTTFEGEPASPSGGLNLSGSTYNADRLKFTGIRTAVNIDGGTVNVRDALINLGSSTSASGIQIANFNNSTSTLVGNLERVTIVGNGSNQEGARVEGITSNPAGETATLNVTDSILDLTGTGSSDLRCGTGGSPDTSTATLNTTRALFDDMTAYGAGGCTAHNDTGKIDRLVTPPVYRDAGSGDYRPTHNSPVVDAGGDGTGAGATDLDGKTRLIDGDGDGTLAIDVGAHEYQRTPPVVSAYASTLYPNLSESVTFNAAATDAEGETVTFTWNFDDGQSAYGASATHAFTTGGTHTATVTATDAAGASSLATLTLHLPVTIIDPSSLTITSKPKRSFKRGSRTFELNPGAGQPYIGIHTEGAGEVRLTLERKRPGVKRSGRCRRGTGRPRCTRYVRMKGSVEFTPGDGDSRITFGGRFGGKKLAAGTYRVTMVASGGFTAGLRMRVLIRLK